MACPQVAIPNILVSPAQDMECEILSPLSLSLEPLEDEGNRASFLTPPPTASVGRQLSPLRPADAPVTGKGLERERFEALLKASRERNAAVGAKKAVDLRKEIALKAHKTKQVERRALFLSKVLSPPSPTGTPKTPPDSPAIFHFTLPSPGLVSPLAAFDPEDPARIPSREPWIERVDFRLLDAPKPQPASRTSYVRASNDLGRNKPLPSLDEITARLSSQIRLNPTPNPTTRSQRLPAFLKPETRSSTPPSVVQEPLPVVDAPKSRPSLDVGRLRMPLRASSLPDTKPTKPSPKPAPRLTDIPAISITSHIEVPTSNVANRIPLDSRARKSKDMLTTLRRRTMTAPCNFEVTVSSQEQHDQERLKRRISAPAELRSSGRSSFNHPVLSMPGGF